MKTNTNFTWVALVATIGIALTALAFTACGDNGNDPTPPQTTFEFDVGESVSEFIDENEYSRLKGFGISDTDIQRAQDSVSEHPFTVTIKDERTNITSQLSKTFLGKLEAVLNMIAFYTYLDENPPDIARFEKVIARSLIIIVKNQSDDYEVVDNKTISFDFDYLSSTQVSGAGSIVSNLYTAFMSNEMSDTPGQFGTVNGIPVYKEADVTSTQAQTAAGRVEFGFKTTSFNNKDKITSTKVSKIVITENTRECIADPDIPSKFIIKFSYDQTSEGMVSDFETYAGNQLAD